MTERYRVSELPGLGRVTVWENDAGGDQPDGSAALASIWYKDDGPTRARLRELVRLANLGAALEKRAEDPYAVYPTRAPTLPPAGGLTRGGGKLVEVGKPLTPSSRGLTPLPGWEGAPLAHEEARLEDDGAPGSGKPRADGAPYPGSWRDKPPLL